MINTDYALTNEQIANYRRDGFIQLNDVITGPDLERLRAAVSGAVDAESEDRRQMPSQAPRPRVDGYASIFIQKVNLWQRHAAVREFALCKRFGNLAARLSGYSIRMWHDQALFKEPQTGSKTPWHQDTHYWPHAQKGHQLSIWIALKDATIHNGCMSFLPGTHQYKNLTPVNLGNPQNLFDIAPQVKGIKPVTCELKAGSVTFHNGLTFHYAGPNKTDGMREAFAILYMPDGTTFNGNGHCVIDKDEFQVGQPLSGAKFPIVSDVKLPALEELVEV
jgi:ectoine hydroxylase-related dioxygenase (phytanoyl-CoA dioxygenase family)